MLEKVLQAEKDALEKEQAELLVQVAEANARLQEIENRLAHVNGLLTPASTISKATGINGFHQTPPAADIAFEILMERSGETMYYKDLAAEVQNRGGDISGENAAQILVARLVKDERFVRPVRKGFYALRKDYPKAKNVGERKRPSRNSNRTSRSSA